jgi:hypothetical protein
MLEIKYEYGNCDTINVSKHDAHILLKYSKLNYLTLIDGIVSNTYCAFTDILNTLQYVSENIENDWKIFKCFMNKETIFHESYIINNNPNLISILADNIHPNILMNRLNNDIISNNIPLLIKHLSLENIYEQFIFYKYIYSDTNIPYTTKIIIILQNNYEQLMTLLDNFQLDVCACAIEDNAQHGWSDYTVLEIVNYYFDDAIKLKLLKQFVICHANWLNNTCMVDMSINIANSAISIIHRNDEILNIKQNIPFYALCHLRNLYKQNDMKIHIIKFLDKIIHQVDFLRSWTNDSKYTQMQIYESLDLFVQIMEDDYMISNGNNNNSNDGHIFHSLMKYVTTAIKTKILLTWFKMSSPSYKCFSESPTYPYSHVSNETPLHIRDIILSKTINDILSNCNMTFKEMGYILALDRLDIYKYLSPNIIKYVTDKCININKSFRSNDISTNIPYLLPNPGKLMINIYDLAYRQPLHIVEVLTLFKNVFESPVKIEYESISDKYDYSEYLYINMYWDYIHITKNYPVMIQNILTIIDFVENYLAQLNSINVDFTILKLVLDKIYPNNMMLNNYVEFIKSSHEFFERGPDLVEILNELTECGVTNFTYIEILQKTGEIIENKRIR